MSHVDAIIEAAIARGEFDNLPGHGKPLNLEDESHIPTEDRMVYRILKNANVLPPEVSAMKALVELRARLAETVDEDEAKALRTEIGQRQAVINMRLERRR